MVGTDASAIKCWSPLEVFDAGFSWIACADERHLLNASGCVPRSVEKERRPPLRHQSIISGGNLRVFENLAQTLVSRRCVVVESGLCLSIYSSARTELDWSPVCRHHAYMIDVFRFDSARRSCQAPRSRSCDSASPVPARTKSRDRYPSCAKTRPFRNRPQISSLDALGIRAESRVFRAAGLTSDPWAGG